MESALRQGASSGRPLTDDELLAHFDESLVTLEKLSAIYDAGHVPIAFAIATEVQKLLTENSAATKLRGQLTFGTPPEKHDRRFVSAFNKLHGVQIKASPVELHCFPAFHSGRSPLALPFRDWWSRDVVYRAGAAPPGSPAGLLPVDRAQEVPYDKRKTVCRREVIQVVRNKRGSHLEAELPQLLEELDLLFGGITFQTRGPDGGELNTQDGSLPVTIGPVPAMVRQIAHEVLVAYDRLDPAPPLPTGV